MNLLGLFSDKNGSLDFREFMLAFAMAKRNDNESKLKLAFKIADSGKKSSTIVHAEIFNKDFMAYYLDKKGKLTKKNLEKLLNAMNDLLGVKHDKKTIKEQREKLFKALDLNSKGSVTESEFLAVLSDDEEVSKSLFPTYSAEDCSTKQQITLTLPTQIRI